MLLQLVHPKTCKILRRCVLIYRELKGRWSWGDVRPLPSYQPGVYMRVLPLYRPPLLYTSSAGWLNGSMALTYHASA